MKTYTLILILIISLSLNYLFYHYSIKYYYTLNRVRLDPLGLKKQIDIPKKDTSLTTISFWGDSRIEQWKLPSIKNFIFINQGIGAQTSEQVLRRFELNLYNSKPDIILLQVGINDLKTIALFPNKKNQIIKQCKNNIERFIHIATKRGSIVIVTTLFPLGEIPMYRKFFWSEDISLALHNINNFIRNINHHSVIIFDAYRLLTQKNHLEYTQGLLHINLKGYLLLNQSLQKLLLTLLSE